MISRSSYRNLLRDGFAGQVGVCHSLASADETLVDDLRVLLDMTISGDPMCPLLWTCKSTRKLAGELQREGTYGQPHDRRPPDFRHGLQSAASTVKLSKERLRQSRPGCPVSAH